MTVDRITAISASLSWISAENGGYEQTFAVTYKEEIASVWQTIRGIFDPGVDRMIVYTVWDLKPETVYLFHVTAENIRGSSPAQPVIFFNTLGICYYFVLYIVL